MFTRQIWKVLYMGRKYCKLMQFVMALNISGVSEDDVWARFIGSLTIAGLLLLGLLSIIMEDGKRCIMRPNVFLHQCFYHCMKMGRQSQSMFQMKRLWILAEVLHLVSVMSILIRTMKTVCILKWKALRHLILWANHWKIVCGKEREMFMFCEMYDQSGEFVTGASVLFVKPKYLKLKKASYHYEITGAEGEFTLCISTDTFAKSVQIDFNNVDAIFSDNFFDLVSNTPCVLTFTTDDQHITAEALKEQIEIYSLCDMN